MNRFTGTLIAIAVFGGLLAWLLIGDPKTKEEREEAALTVVSAERDAIDRIALSNTHGEMVFEKDGKGWRITAPIQHPVEDSAANQMLNALSSLAGRDLVWKSPTAEDRKKAGLSPAAATIRFQSDEGDHTLHIGKPFAKSDAVYVSKDEQSPIFLARAWSVQVFGKTLDEFRRKKLFDFHRDEVRALRVEVPGRDPLAMTRTDALEPWRTESPFEARADRGKVNGLLTALSNLRASEFVGPAKGSHGLDPPRSAISFTTSDGETHRLDIGAVSVAGEDPAWYASVGTAEEVVLTSGTLPESFQEPFDRWRDPSLFDFPVDDVTSLELTIGKETVSVHRDDEKNWKTTGATTGSPAGRHVGPEATAFLRQAKLAKSVRTGSPAPAGSSQATRYGLASPVLAGSWATPREKFELTVGGTESGTDARWVRTAESDQAFLVEEDLVKAALELHEASLRPPATPTPEPDGGATLIIEKPDVAEPAARP